MADHLGLGGRFSRRFIGGAASTQQKRDNQSDCHRRSPSTMSHCHWLSISRYELIYSKCHEGVVRQKQSRLLPKNHSPASSRFQHSARKILDQDRNNRAFTNDTDLHFACRRLLLENHVQQRDVAESILLSVGSAMEPCFRTMSLMASRMSYNKEADLLVPPVNWRHDEDHSHTLQNIAVAACCDTPQSLKRLTTCS